MKMDRMAYDAGIIRESNTALLNHNKCVDKINEIIDVVNALEDPGDKNIRYCPFCGAPLKYQMRAEERITLKHQEQEQILKSLGELCGNHKKYNCRRLDRYQGIYRDTTPEIYSHLCNATRKAIICILNRFELPLLDSAPYSFLKENIEYIISKEKSSD